jgi:cell division septation protein DedD
MSVENQPVILPEELKAAIACLDLSLESELALYRNRQKQESMALAALPSAEMEASAPQSFDLALEPFSHDDSSEEALAGSLSKSDERSETAPAEAVDQEMTAVIEDDEIETLPESYGAELTAEPKAFDQFLDPSIEDYLESSEALLKHLDDPAKAEITPVEDGGTAAKRSWVVISGVTLLILGLLALAGFLGVLAMRWFSLKPVSVPTPQPLVSPSASLPPSPNAAIAPTEGVPPNPVANATVTPTPSATPTAPINPNASRYVVLATDSQASLQTARQLVPDAFIAVVDGQQRIQLADLESLQQAQQMVNELKNQGFPASIVAQN